MSRRYDFGYKLEAGSTNEWAFELIADNSKVLELGAAVGNVTKHLKEIKNCEVDIIEFDIESGSMAKEFARKALLGPEEGDLNNDNWYKILQEERYDYIVILDVLEHLNDPKSVLKKLKNLLKHTGKVITSIPNISNNAIIVNLLNDKFEYTELGLLDSTHKYFMTYHSIVQMVEELGYNLDYISAIAKDAGMSEVMCTYEDVPEEVADYIKGRTIGTAYQFLVILGKEKGETENCLMKACGDKVLFKSLIMFNGLSEGMLTIDNKSNEILVDFEIDVSKGVRSVRFIPDEHACIVDNLQAKIWRNGEVIEIEPNWTSGVKLENGSHVFGKSSQEINYPLEGSETRMQISCQSTRIYNNTLETLQKCIDTIVYEREQIDSKNIELVKNAEMIQNQTLLTHQQQNTIGQQQEMLSNQLMMLQRKDEEIEVLYQDNQNIYAELQAIKSTKWYRLMDKIRRIGKRES